MGVREALRLGVQGKIALWEVLGAVWPGDAVGATRFEALATRARRQAATLDDLHRRAAASVFA
ncbi:MAG: hypothetical protein ACRDWI_09005 [Jiangellaceae bacterium]